MNVENVITNEKSKVHVPDQESQHDLLYRSGGWIGLRDGDTHRMLYVLCSAAFKPLKNILIQQQ